MDREERRLIPYQRVKEEGLRFVDNEIVGDDGQNVIHSTITDAAGIVYDAVLHEDGTVGTDYCHYDSVETYQRVKGPFETLCSFTWGYKHRYHIVRDQNRDIYLHHYWEIVGCSDHIEAIKTVGRLAEIMFDDHDDTDHSLIFEFPKSGHWAVRLLEEVRNEIEQTAYYQLEDDKSRQELIVERVRRPLKTEEELSALLKERWRRQQEAAPKTEEERLQRNAALFKRLGINVTEQESDPMTGEQRVQSPQVASLVEKIRQRQAAAKEPNINLGGTTANSPAMTTKTLVTRQPPE
jgi:hypothetical protein